MRSRLACLISTLALCGGITAAGAAEMTVTVNIPRIDTSEYHRPYVAIWIEGADRAVAANLAVWYQVDNKEGTKWLADLRQWWRRSGREQDFPIDGVTGATRPVGQHQLKFDATRSPLKDLAPGEYALVVEAVREVGGREMVRLPFTWPATAPVNTKEAGESELGAVVLGITP